MQHPIRQTTQTHTTHHTHTHTQLTIRSHTHTRTHTHKHTHPNTNTHTQLTIRTPKGSFSVVRGSGRIVSMPWRFPNTTSVRNLHMQCAYLQFNMPCPCPRWEGLTPCPRPRWAVLTPSMPQCSLTPAHTHTHTHTHRHTKHTPTHTGGTPQRLLTSASVRNLHFWKGLEQGVACQVRRVCMCVCVY